VTPTGQGETEHSTKLAAVQPRVGGAVLRCWPVGGSDGVNLWHGIAKFGGLFENSQRETMPRRLNRIGGMANAAISVIPTSSRELFYNRWPRR
jgi:hypothetical protein